MNREFILEALREADLEMRFRLEDARQYESPAAVKSVTKTRRKVRQAIKMLEAAE